MLDVGDKRSRCITEDAPAAELSAPETSRVSIVNFETTSKCRISLGEYWSQAEFNAYTNGFRIGNTLNFGLQLVGRRATPF